MHLHSCACMPSFVHAVPVNSPQNVTATPISSTAVYVEWKEVPPIDRNGVIIAYQVLYQSRVPGQISASVLTSNLSVLLEGLHPFMEYGILVSASTSVGSGPLSDVVYVTTLEGRKTCYIVVRIIKLITR